MNNKTKYDSLFTLFDDTFLLNDEVVKQILFKIFSSKKYSYDWDKENPEAGGVGEESWDNKEELKDLINVYIDSKDYENLEIYKEDGIDPEKEYKKIIKTLKMDFKIFCGEYD